jgi:aspartyl/asparaginyl beta-hydroxylase (cupin superfamily)
VPIRHLPRIQITRVILPTTRTRAAGRLRSADTSRSHMLSLATMSEQPRSAFFPTGDFPELEHLRCEWREIQDEARSLLPAMMWLEDDRTTGKVWALGPLILEEGDRTPDRDHLADDMRRRATRTMTLLRQIPTLLGCAFSLLVARSRIDKHIHSMPFVTAILGLSPADPCWITVGSETRHIHQGELTIFDYTQPHEVINASDVDRLALLILLPNKSL